MSTENKITVLGLTFNSEEERRSYFREELRKKLPELKLMEGFPIGEDEDILNLSDPPYYTACPNPWLNDFIALWEAEKKELEKQGLRKANFEVIVPFSSDLNAQKNHPLYNAHNYHTKVPHEIIMKYILYYTQPGDIVLDSFSGTGMTGVAANYCTKPYANEIQEIKYKNFYEDVCFQEIGERKVIQGDLSPLASFIGHNHTNKTNLSDFKKTAENIYNEVFSKHGDLFKTKIDKRVAEINYVIWSENLSCTSCNHVFNYWDVAVPTMGLVLNEFKCPNCDTTLKRSILVSKRTEYKTRRYKALNLYSNGKTETKISQLQDECCNGVATR